MRRLSALLTAGFLLFAAPSTRAADWPQIKSRGTLRVLMVQVGEADEFLRAGLPPDPGLDGEVLRGFSQLHKIKLELLPQPSWDTLIPGLQQGKGDLVAGRFTVTESRQKLVAFSSEVFPSRNVVMTRKPNPIVTSLEALRALKVGTIRGTSMAEAVAAAGVPKANVNDSFPPGGLPAGLQAGQVAAVVLGLESAIAAQRSDPEIQLGMFLGPPRSLAYAVRREDGELLKTLNEYIDNVRRTPTWNRLVVKYFGEAALPILKQARSE
ncbi:MAG TPA: transporter substrate-binding domain-containing protein [Vicinamibacteria bacterium]|nr:transporter substrate-binding domain-containing protein [Vicinamibacteria bacterium]